MRSKSKGPKHISSEKSEKNIIPDISKNLKAKFNISNSYVPYICGIAVLTVTTAFSLNFAFGSQWNAAVDNAYAAIDSNLIYNGVFVEEVNISNITKEQATRRVNELYVAPRLAKSFTITYGDYSKDVTYADLGGKYDVKSVVNEAYSLGRSGSKEARIVNMEQLSNSNEFLVPDFDINKSKLKNTINSIAKEIEEMYPDKGKVSTDGMIDDIEKNMLIGISDIDYNVSFE